MFRAKKRATKFKKESLPLNRFYISYVEESIKIIKEIYRRYNPSNIGNNFSS